MQRAEDHTLLCQGRRDAGLGYRMTGGVSIGMGGQESPMWRLLSRKMDGETLLYQREGMGSCLGLRCCCLQSWWDIRSTGSDPQSSFLCSKEEVHRNCHPFAIWEEMRAEKGLKGTPHPQPFHKLFILSLGAKRGQYKSLSL